MSQVIVILGSESDKKIVGESRMADIFESLGVSFEVAIISAHRDPRELMDYCLKTANEGALVYIGVAGMAAQLPGIIASHIRYRPVIGVPLVSGDLLGLDALLSMVRMPSDVPVFVPGMVKPGLDNAAIGACQIIALTDPAIEKRLKDFIESNRPEPKFNVELSIWR